MTRLSLILSVVGMLFSGPLFGQVTDERIGCFLQVRSKAPDKITQRDIDLYRVYELNDVHNAERAESIVGDVKSCNEIEVLRKRIQVSQSDLEMLKKETNRGNSPRREFLEKLCGTPLSLVEGIGGENWTANATRVKSGAGPLWVFPGTELRLLSPRRKQPNTKAISQTKEVTTPPSDSVTLIENLKTGQFGEIGYQKHGRNGDDYFGAYQYYPRIAVDWFDQPLGAEFVIATGLTINLLSSSTSDSTTGTASVSGRLQPISVPFPKGSKANHPYEILKIQRDGDAQSGWYELTSMNSGYPKGPIRYESFEFIPTVANTKKRPVTSNGGMMGHRMLGTTADGQTAFTWRFADGMLFATRRKGESTELGLLMSPDELDGYQELDRAARAKWLDFHLFSSPPYPKEEIEFNVGLAGIIRRQILSMIFACTIDNSLVAGYVSPVDHSIKVRDFRANPSATTSHPVPPGWTLQSCGLRNVSGQPVLITVERPEAEGKGRIRANPVSTETKKEPITLYEFDTNKNAAWGTAVNDGKTLFGAATNVVDSRDDRIDAVEVCLEDVLK